MAMRRAAPSADNLLEDKMTKANPQKWGDAKPWA